MNIDRPLIIAHRGASGYLPEHTLESKALAFGMGADFLEQDVLCTSDEHPIVFHDPWLEGTTNVAECFPGRARVDGHYWVADFSLEEIRQLSAQERVDTDTGQPSFPGRFPASGGEFNVVTLAEEIRFLRGLNRSTGRKVGLYPEIKHPAPHRELGIDISAIVMDVLATELQGAPEIPVWIQCFDSGELMRLKDELTCPWPLVQLLDQREDPPDMPVIASYAQAVGPAIEALLENDGALVEDARKSGIEEIHVWTLRRDRLPDGYSDFDILVKDCVAGGATGLFTDFPDLVYAWRLNA